MPEWCIYVMGADAALANWGLKGAFAFLSYDESSQEAALQFLLDMNDDTLLATLPVCLNTGSVPGQY